MRRARIHRLACNLTRLSAAVVMVLGNSIRDGFRALGIDDTPSASGPSRWGASYFLGLLALLRAPETRARPLMEDDSTD